jgi:hypothetical protein
VKKIRSAASEFIMNAPSILLPTILAAFVWSSSAAQPTISNRAPRPNEIGYRPADGTVSRLNPPSLIWLHEPAAQSYTVQWSPTASFEVATTAAGLPFNTYTHHTEWPAGAYHWRYQFTATNGALSTWSISRSVVIPEDAVEFPMPTRAQQRERVPGEHPRLFLRPEDLPRLRERARTTDAARFEQLRIAADRIIKAGPTPEPAHLGSARDKNNKELIKYWWPNREQTMKACQEAETLAFVYLITGEEKYGRAARQWILHLAAWNPDGPTNFHLNCEAAKPLIYRLPRAYDWAYGALTPEDRAIVQRAMLRRATDAWESWEVRRGSGHLTEPFGSHANRTWHKLGECAIAFLGEIPEAETWLDYAVNKFHACFPVWSDDDGGWHEGVSYWGGYMSKAVWWLQVSQSALGVDGLKKPFFSQVGDFPLYVAPPHSPNMGFADLSFRPPPSSWGGFMEFFIRAKGSQPDGAQAGHWRWWTEQWKMREEGGILGFLYHANLPPLPPAKPPVDLPPSKVFRGIGVASLHTTLLDSRDDVHFLFKSSPFGTQSHGHNPHNSFQLNAYGEELLTTCVFRDLHGSKFHYGWTHSTVAHNAVLVNGQGQIKHTSAPHGRIADSKLTPEWDYLVGDATDAYGGRLERYQRHVAFVKNDAGPVIVIYDELVAKEPSTFQFMLHAFQEFAINEQQAQLATDRRRAGVEVKYLSPAPLSFRQWDGYDPPPDREFPNQWHVEAGTREKRKEIGVFTVIVPYRTGQKPAWAAERIESDSAAGVRFQRDGKSVAIAFRKGTGAQQASVAGISFDGPVEVK